MWLPSDNGALNFMAVEPSARALYLVVDQEAMNVTLQQQWLPIGFSNYTASQGSVIIESDGNVLVSWGTNPYISEYT